ncbi:MAG: FHA domain-containing protein [Planctomycetes bacterium]|nr:FHA domain-containing protein [Planctomycetota bacterium]
MSVKITLTFTNGTLKGQKREFSRPGKVVIGRSNDCDLQLPTTLEFMDVSRHHCVLDIDPPALQVRDLGSRNGTFVNGENISQRRGSRDSGSGEVTGANGEPGWHVLKEGDELRIGSITLRVEVSVRPVREAVGRGAGLWPFFRLWARSAIPC